jgi:hypothetical protein
MQLPRALPIEEALRKRPSNVSAGDGGEEGIYPGSEETNSDGTKHASVQSSCIVIRGLRRERQHLGVRLLETSLCRRFACAYPVQNSYNSLLLLPGEYLPDASSLYTR